jgi:AbiV family abortive infection protein
MGESAQVAIIENAERLLKDADLLAANGSYRTAISLAVLSTEESGKACLVCWKSAGHITRDISEELRSGHIDKQLIFATYRATMAIFSAGKVFRTVPPTNVHAPWEEPAFKRAFARALREEALIPQMTAAIGLLDHFKQAGFYVDLDDSMNIVAPGVAFNSEWYEMVASDAREALKMARVDSFTHQLMAIIYNSGWSKKMSVKERRLKLRGIVEGIKKHLSDHE